MALLALASPSLAGVVEDAEESLQVVPADHQGARNLDGSAGSLPKGSLSQGSTGSSSSTASSGVSANSASKGIVRQPNGQSGGQAAGSYPDVSETPPAAEQEAVRRRQARNRADTTMSLVGVLVLLALVLAAGLYSKRVGRDD
jgi:cobalamin biosynthesis Mg chelatase CobN